MSAENGTELKAAWRPQSKPPPLDAIQMARAADTKLANTGIR